MLKKKMAAGVVALAMFSTLGLAACNPGGSSSDSSRGGSAAAGSIPQPDVACDIPEGNLDNSKDRHLEGRRRDHVPDPGSAERLRRLLQGQDQGVRGRQPRRQDQLD